MMSSYKAITKKDVCIRFEYLNIVPFDINIKLQQGKFMKKLSLDPQPESITKHFPLRYIDSINNTNSDKLIIPYDMDHSGSLLTILSGLQEME